MPKMLDQNTQNSEDNVLFGKGYDPDVSLVGYLACFDTMQQSV